MSVYIIDRQTESERQTANEGYKDKKMMARGGAGEG